MGGVFLQPMTDTIALTQRVYINAFPKSGTHLAEAMIAPVVPPLGRSWLGNMTDHAWTTDASGNDDKIVELCELWPQVGYLKGHMSHNDKVADALYFGDVCVFFVVRNLRDVAVSSAYHVLDERRDADGEYILKHPNKAMYQQLGSFTAVLKAIINGIGEFPSLAARWQLFAPWLNESWVKVIRFEDMIQRPKQTASEMFMYMWGQSAAYAGVTDKIQISQSFHDAMVKQMADGRKQKTVTFRKGKAGGWRKYFNDEIEAAWEASGAAEANEVLGYG